MEDPRTALFREKYGYLDGLTDGFWVWPLTGNVMGYEYCSPGMSIPMGLPKGALAHTPDSWKHLIHPEDLVKAEAALAPHLAGLGDYNLIVRYKYHTSVGADGTILDPPVWQGDWVWIQCRGNAEFDSEGNPTLMVGKHTVITDRVRAAQDASPAIAAMEDAGRELMASMEDLEGLVSKMANDE